MGDEQKTNPVNTEANQTTVDPNITPEEIPTSDEVIDFSPEALIGMSSEKFNSGDWGNVNLQRSDVDNIIAQATTLDDAQSTTEADDTLDTPVSDASEQSNDDANTEQSDETDEVTVKALEAYNKLIGVPIKAAGTEITFNSIDEVIKGLQQAADYTKKTAKIKPYRETLSALADVGVLENKQDLNIMIDAFKGNKEAIAYLIEKHEIDLTTVSDKYVPNEHGKSINELNLEDTLNELKENNQLDQVVKVTSSFDDSSIELLRNEPNLMVNIANDIQSGLYEKIQSEIMKEKLIGAVNPSENSINQYARIASKLLEQEMNSNSTTPTNTPNKVPNTPTPNNGSTVPQNRQVVNPPSSVGNTPAVGGGQMPNRDVLNASINDLAQSMAGMPDEEWKRLFGS